MEDNTGFRKKPRPVWPSDTVQVVDCSSGSRPGGKAGGTKGGSAKSQPAGNSMRVVSARSKKPTPDVADHISRQLKAVYDDMLNQPVPDRFIDLLSQLDSASGK
ncbi:MAG TPA: NepR family anti-sigma factor [Beijerinckiaceae bacterium]|nr:NepR family anti-sigma factor [Beijerinckiaceae bacterium]